MKPFGFVADLCVALAHNWEPERIFVILTIYLDESGTHGDATHMTMGALMATALQWSRIEKKLRKLSRDYGFRAFHTKEFTKRSGQFKGWSRERCMDLLAAVADRTMTVKLMESVTVAVNRADFDAEYRNTPWPKGVKPDSLYGFCFRTCLEHLLLEAHKRCRKPKIHVVLERGAKNEGDCQRIFWDLQEDCPSLQAFTTGNKDNCPPLWYGDILATSTYRTNRDNRVGPLHPIGTLKARKNSVLNLAFPKERMAPLKAAFIRKELAKRGAKK